MARHVLREQLKQIIKDPGTQDETEIVTAVEKYLKNESGAAEADNIIAPKDKGSFLVTETMLTQLSSGKSLYGTLYDTSSSQADSIPGVATADANTAMGVPGGKTAKDVVDLWAANYARNHANTNDGHVDMTFGYDYRQLFPKYIMGAAFYNAAVDKYLDEYIGGAKPHGSPYKPNKYYTGAEHSWDEGFGYFGAAANYGILTPAQNKAVKKQKEAHFADADWDGSGGVSLYTEYTSGPAYYAADADIDGKSTYGNTIMGAWLAGRDMIANATGSDGYARDLTPAEQASMNSYAKIIKNNWEKVIAEAVYKYVGAAHNEIVKIQADANDTAAKIEYFAVWSEAKGFMLGLQYGGTGSIIDKTNFMEIDGLIGFGPVMPDGSQVNGVTGTGGLTFSKTSASTTALEEYKAKLKEVQTKLDALYMLKSKKNPIS